MLAGFGNSVMTPLKVFWLHKQIKKYFKNYFLDGKIKRRGKDEKMYW